MRAIILANGHGKRFGDREKLLVDVQGKPLLLRTIDQVRCRGIYDICVVTSRPEIKNIISKDVQVLDFGPPQFMLVDWHKAMKYWKDETIVLLGDVVWTDVALGLTINRTHYTRIGNKVLHTGEGFGWKMFEADKERIKEASFIAINYVHNHGPQPGDGGWQMYRYLIGAPLDQHIYDEEIFLDLGRLGDLTMDLDFESDYVRLKNEIEPRL